MTENRRKKEREYFEKVLKDPIINSKMDKETILKKICKHHLLVIFEFGKVIGKCLSEKESEKSKRVGKALEQAFKKQFGFELTISLKKAGVLPLPIYGKKAA